VTEEVGSSSKAKFTNHRSSPSRDVGEIIILSNLEMNRSPSKVDLEYIIETVKQAYEPRV
jgi:hypothetical protein